MATVALSSPKGGVAKTTTALLLATHLALGHDYQVAVLDADNNQHSAAFAAKAKIPKFNVVPEIGEANVLAALRKAEGENDIVFIDLPGATSTLNLKALQRSHFVLIPCQRSLLDVRDAFKGLAQIEDAEDLARNPIARAIMWSRVASSFESRSARHVREEVERRGVDLFSSCLYERAAYQEMHLTGRVPSQVDQRSPAAENVAALAAELLGRLASLAEKAA